MPDDHDPGTQPFCVGSPNVVFRQHVQQARPGDPGDQRGIDKPKGNARQGDTPEKRFDPFPDADKALHRKNMRMDGKPIDQDVADHKNGDGEPENSKNHDQIVDPRPSFTRR